MRPAAALLLVLAAGCFAERPIGLTRKQNPTRFAPAISKQLYPGTKYVFEARNPTKGSEPAILVLDADFRPLAWNDDWPKPRLEYLPPRRGAYYVQVRAREGTLEGQCDLYMNGKPLATKLRFGARK